MIVIEKIPTLTISHEDWLRERFQKFARCLQERAEWFDALVRDSDEVYAVEKLRQEAERCSGTGITYLYEQDILAAQEKHSKTGWQQP